MRIHSKFKDYYDSALKDFDTDPTPVYDRTQVGIVSKRLVCARHISNYHQIHIKQDVIVPKVSTEKLRALGFNHQNELTTLRLIVVGFCGKLYPAYSTFTAPHNGKKTTADLWDREDIITKYVINHPQLGVVCKDDFWNTFKVDCEIVDGLEQLVNCQSLKSLFIKHNTPSFIYMVSLNNTFNEKKSPILYINPHLGDVKFHNVMNPYTAIQELDMFLNNDLVKDKQPKMPVGSDVIIAESKGFDKYSFRKSPEN